MILDGQVVGRWRRLPGAKSAIIDVQLGRPLAAPELDALNDGVERHARFLELPVSLRLDR